MPIVYTLITPLPREFQSSWGIFNMMRRYNVKQPDKLPIFMLPGSREREIPEAVKPAQGDILLDKATASIFIGTNFELMMKNRRITTLLFTGIATELGIESSARDASNRGFYPVVVSDCVSSMDRDAHERSLKILERVAIVKNSTEIIEHLKQLLKVRDQETTIDISADQLRQLCGRSPLPEVCKEWKKNEEMTCFCLESVLRGVGRNRAKLNKASHVSTSPSRSSLTITAVSLKFRCQFL